MFSKRTTKQKQDFQKYILDIIKKFPTTAITENLTDWAEKNAIIVEGSYQGSFSFRTAPYLEEIADNLSVTSKIQEIGVIKANQLGFSTISFIAIAYYINFSVGPQLFVSGDEGMAGETFEKRLDPLLEACGLRDKIKPIVDKKGMARTSGDTKHNKSYGGTFLRATGPNSEGKLRSFPARIAIVEEIDVFPQNLKGTGNPVEKIIRRTDNFATNRKLYFNSTPKQKSNSQIAAYVEAGDHRLYMWICKKCGKQQPFVFEGFGWDTDENGNPDLIIDTETGSVLKDPVYYCCQNPECNHKYKNSDKYELMAKENGALWVPTKKPTRPNMRTYQIPSFYSFTRTWLDIFMQYWRVKDDPLLFPDFVNDVLGEASENVVKIPTVHYLMARRETWTTSDDIPNEVYFITLSCDVQGNRLEASLQGWGKNAETYMLKYWVFEGKTDNINSPCWQNLENVITNEYKRLDDTVLRLVVTFIDAGFNTEIVKEFCSIWTYKKGRVNGVYPVFGRDENIIGKKNYTISKNLGIATPEVTISDQKYKKLVYHYLDKEKTENMEQFPRGYIHFPNDLTESYFKQLTAEELIEETDRFGKKKVKIQNPKKRRNEALDLMKMNFAVLQFMCGEYFENINKRRRAVHKSEIAIDLDTFIEYMRPSTEE